MAADLDLMIDAAEKFDDAVGATTTEIAGAIEAPAGSPNGSGRKLAAVRSGRFEIAAPDLDAGHAYLAGDADRRGLEPSIEDVESRIVHGTADRNAQIVAFRRAVDRIIGHIVRTFGGTIGVEQAHMRKALHEEPAELRSEGLAAG